MANPMLNNNNNNLGGLSMLKQLKQMASNPNLLKQNPQIQSILSMYKGDAKAAFYALCKQKGIDPNDILNQIK